MSGTRPAVLTADGVTWKPAARRVLGPLDLAVETGETLVLLGPNGAGKTTLLRLLAGLLRPTTGTVRLDGRPLAGADRRAVARRIAYVPQSRDEGIPLTVKELALTGRFPHLASPYGRLGWAPRAADRAAVARALQEVDVVHLAERPLGELSGGERQSAFMAAALAQEPDILLLDEPTTHLDPRHQRDIAALLVRLRRTETRPARTVVVATHDVAFAALVADRVAALRDGVLLQPVETAARALTPVRLRRLFEAPFLWLRDDAVQVASRQDDDKTPGDGFPVLDLRPDQDAPGPGTPERSR